MKKKLVIFRFGSNMPTQKEYAIIQTICAGTNHGIGCGTAFGVISIVKTSFTPDEIVNLYKKVAHEHNDSLPVIVWDPAGDTGVHLCPLMFKAFAQADADFDQMYGDEPCTLNLDELLELISDRGGIESLTAEELTRLHELSSRKF